MGGEGNKVSFLFFFFFEDEIGKENVTHLSITFSSVFSYQLVTS